MSADQRDVGGKRSGGGSIWFGYMLAFGGLCFIAGYSVSRTEDGQRGLRDRVSGYAPEHHAAPSATPTPERAPTPKGSLTSEGGLKGRRGSAPSLDPTSEDPHPKARRLSQRAKGPERPSVSPLQGAPAPQLPQGHPKLPKTDRHGHPSFDCSALKAPVPRGAGQPSIEQLLRDKGAAQGEVEVYAFVIGAYYGILGTNWYHLCDQPDGHVLVVSSDQLAPKRGLISARGPLLYDYNLSDVYRFPIYIKGAALSGSQVRSPTPQLPQGVSEL